MDDKLAVARAFFGAFARKDLAAARACLSPRVRWRVPGRSAISGAHEGPDAVISYFAKLRELTDGTWQAHPIDMLEGATGVVVLARGTGQRGTRAFDATYALHLRIADGLIVEATLYPEDLHAFESFWA